MDHPLMSRAQWQQAYRGRMGGLLFAAIISKRVLRRAEATNSSPGKVITQLNLVLLRRVMLEDVQPVPGRLSPA